MTSAASRSKCATRRASLRPRNRGLPISCGARSAAWMKTISAPACSAVRIGCAADNFPIRPKPLSPAICKSWVSRFGKPARALGSAQTASKDGAVNRAMDDLSRLRDQLAGLGGRPNGQGQPGQSQPAGQQYQPGQLSRNGQPGQSGQPGQQGQQQGPAGQPDSRGKRDSRDNLDRADKVVKSATAPPVRSAMRAAVGIAAAQSMATTTPATRASPGAPRRHNRVPIPPIRSAKSSRG